MVKSLFSLVTALLILIPAHSSAQSDYEYQLYQNHEKFGIVVFPKSNLYADLEETIRLLGFEVVTSGEAVMRYGPRGQNQTFMMPPDVQKKHSVERFIILQVLADHNLLIGIYDPDWELTLPSTIFPLDEVKKRIPQTLDAFRKTGPRKEILWRPDRYSTGGNSQIIIH